MTGRISSEALVPTDANLLPSNSASPGQYQLVPGMFSETGRWFADLLGDQPVQVPVLVRA